jgi:arabinose-5-phosphate isomerase
MILDSKLADETELKKKSAQQESAQKESMLEELFAETQNNVAYFFKNFDLDDLEKLWLHLLASPGSVFLSGVGKSGIIAKKIATTMSSSGTKALFLSPINALHGDLGVVARGDTVLLFSKSGESDELLQLCPALRNKGAFLVAVVSNKESRLAKSADMTVCLPVSKELCPFDLAPTTSTLVQLMFGDLLAIALMRAKHFTKDDFAQNHPAGRLGRRLLLTVQDLMLKGRDLPLAKPEDTLISVLAEFSSKKCGCLMIVDQAQTLLGIFTDGDLRRSLEKHGASVLEKKMGELMTENPRFIPHTSLAFDAMKTMEIDPKKPITVLPVLNEHKRVEGIIRMHDIVQSGL